MARHPRISTAVTELVYDITTFRLELSHEDYWQEFAYGSGFIEFARRWRDQDFCCPDPQISQFVKDHKKGLGLPGTCKHRYGKAIEQHRRDQFVDRDYKTYQANARYEQHALQSGNFLGELCAGLRRLSRLETVILSDTEWGGDLMERRPFDSSILYSPSKGSPLIRRWHPFYLQPKSTWYGSRGSHHIGRHFQISMSALARSKRCIDSFKIDALGGLLPPSAFSLSTMSGPILCIDQTNEVFCNLERLELSFNVQLDTHSHDHLQDIKDLTSLPVLLLDMPKLRSLDLAFWPHEDNEPFWRYNPKIMFPTGMSRILTEVSITGLAITAVELLSPLVWSQPHLRKLDLGCLDLKSGTWEGVVEALAQRQIEEMRFFGTLTHNEGFLFVDSCTYRHDGRDKRFADALERYVVYRGRHPCLAPDSPPYTEWKWYTDLFPEEVVQQAFKLSGIRGSTLIDLWKLLQ